MKKQFDINPNEVTSDISRRKFLKSAASGGATLVVASGISLESAATEKPAKPKTNSPFKEVLARCGSEFGDVRECN